MVQKLYLSSSSFEHELLSPSSLPPNHQYLNHHQRPYKPLHNIALAHFSKPLKAHKHTSHTPSLLTPTMDSTPTQSRPAESKSAKKKRAKTESGANGSVGLAAVPDVTSKEDSSLDAKADGDGSYEHPYIKELNKQVRNTHKKLSGMQKVDAVIAENPNTSLDDLVAQRKINNDQKASALKKPQLQQQLAELDSQISQYRKFDADFQQQLSKQKEDLTAAHIKEVEKLREELSNEGKTVGLVELRSKLLTLSQFLRCAASKRLEPAEADSEAGYAFEGALLGVYGGDDKAVDTAIKLIDGADEQVPNVEGSLTSVKCKYTIMSPRHVTMFTCPSTTSGK